MTKRIVFLFVLFLMVGCGEEENYQRKLYVEGEDLAYEVKQEKEDYQIPLDLVLDALQISYEVETERILFGNIELIEESDIAFVDGNARELSRPVKKVNDNIYVSLKFLTENLPVNYVEDAEKLNIRLTSEILLNCDEALKIFAPGEVAKVTDLETGASFEVRRVEKSPKKSIADVETKTAEDTEILLEIIGGDWNHYRRAILVEVDNKKIAAAIIPIPHSGRDDRPFGEEVDNRSGNMGTGINLNSITDNDLVGVVDIYFYNSIMPGSNRIDERAQEKVLEAAFFSR